ncbi:gamma-glutamyltransferase family protein [Rhizobium sp. FKL33]|uniref:gamma-glutamyltransferase family protein n=1 Tax=Rhizobium sp. FKL33 TaxID=2562307 RepID=UPI0010BFB0A1|nr:gamma-glutamyltransferase family protein [Rhizobium sp. FKL33]
MDNLTEPRSCQVVCQNAMAATSHPASTIAALDILRAGGNAVDAAVGVCAVQGVVEAGSTGIGGDCFALLAKGGSDQIIGYNGSGRTPASAQLNWYLKQGIESIGRQSPHSVTVPGAVEAWARLVADHGRMGLHNVLAPAIRYARDGYALTPCTAKDLSRQCHLLRQNPTARSTFLVEGEAPISGAIQRQPLLAETLEAIAREGSEVFYRGDIAKDVVGYLRDNGGLHTREDFALARGQYVNPIKRSYRQHTVVECGPNGQGIAALLILAVLERFRIAGNPLSLSNVHREIEATRVAYLVRDKFLGDPDYSKIPINQILSARFIDEMVSKIDLERISPPCEGPNLVGVEHMDTVCISVVDKDRNAVSLINSIFHTYGSGMMSPRCGVLLHNRAQSFVLERSHPNALGPAKRPLHTIIPGMLTQNGRVVMPFGVVGGHYQAMGHAHLLSKVLDYGMDLQSAINLPRVFPVAGTNVVEVEEDLLTVLGEGLEGRGFVVRTSDGPIGGAQAIWIDWGSGNLLGGSDRRKDGCALGY